MAKHRTSIPKEVAAHVRWLSDDTCCICRERRKEIQIHHINGDPRDHSVENLAVLCLECHDNTQKKGGFTRKLDPQFVTLCRDKWLEDVASRRADANKKDVERQVGKNSRSEQPSARPRNKVQHTQLSEFPRGYIESLPKFKSDLLQQIKKQIANGTTLDIIEANSHYANALKSILTTLATFYSSEYFKDQPPQEFFLEIISARDRFHSIIVEPYGPNTGGTIRGIRYGLERIKDIEKLVEDMVNGLWEECYSEYEDWQKLWRDSDMQSDPMGEEITESDFLSKLQLHPIIAEKVWSFFLQGAYGSAVFEAFKQVEIAVREAGGYAEKERGTNLMRKAFHVESGNLTDQSQHAAEKQARSDLFAGAMGAYKNPGSHREVDLTAEEAIELIIFASHLLRIVDTCSVGT